MVTGDDTPAGGINGNGFGPFNDQLTDEQQTVRVTNATGGTFTLTFNGQTTAPIAYNATAAQIDAALEALSNIGANNIQTSGGPVNTANVNVFFRRALQQADQPQITANGAGLTGTARRRSTHRDGAGGRLVPAADRRRPPLDAEHQRPARQGPAHQGQGRRHHRRRRQQGRPRHRHGRLHDPVRQPVPARSAGAPQAQDPARDLRDGLPQPVPHPGRRERRRLRRPTTRRTPRRRSAAAGPRASAASRSCASRPTTASRSATRASSATTSGTSTSSRRAPRPSGTPLDNPPQPIDCGDPTRSSTTRAGTVDGGPGFEPGLRDAAAGHRSGHLVLLPRQQRGDAARHAVLRLLRDDPGPDRARLDDRVPAAVPRALHGRRRAARRGEVPLRPGQPEHEEVPAVLRQLGHPRRVHAGHAARGQARRAEPRPQDQQLPATAAQANVAAAGVPVRVRQPDGHAVRHRRLVLPADLRRRVLRRQPRRRPVPLGLRQGPARAEGRARPPTRPTAPRR